jgi:hypothetical protein
MATIFGSDVRAAGKSVEDGLKALAKALSNRSYYTVNVIVMPGATEDEIGEKVGKIIDRIEARERARDHH